MIFLILSAAPSRQGWAADEQGDSDDRSGLDLTLPPLGYGDLLDLEDNPLFFDPFEPRPIPPREDGMPDDRPFALDVVDPAAVQDGSRGEVGAERPAGDDVPLSPLVAMALEVAPSVLALRVWDEFGSEIANGCGFFVSDGGLVLTDASLINPAVCRVADYITAVDGFGRPFRIAGVLWRDLFSGVALLQAEVPGDRVQPLRLAATGERLFEASADHPVRVLALNESRGLVLADASARPDSSVTGMGWLTVTGRDSPGAVGSPVLNDEGAVVAMVAMKLPGPGWVNFATGVDDLASALAAPSRTPTAVSRLRQLEPGDPLEDRRFLAAYEDLRSGRAKRAARVLLRLTKAYPRSAECWALLGFAASEIGAESEAVACFQRAAALEPETADYWKQLAVTEISAGVQRDGASVARALEQAVHRSPADFVAWTLLGQEHLRAGEFDQAVSAFRRSLIIKPGFAHAHYLLACSLARTGDLDAAEAAIRRAVELDRSNDGAWFYLGLVMSRKGRHEEAVTALEKAVRINSRHPEAWLNLAHAYRAVRRENEATQAFRRHVDIRG